MRDVTRCGIDGLRWGNENAPRDGGLRIAAKGRKPARARTDPHAAPGRQWPARSSASLRSVTPPRSATLKAIWRSAYDIRLPSHMRLPDNRTPHGEVAEWSKAHAWNACRRETVSRVRIPVCPPPKQPSGLNGRKGCPFVRVALRVLATRGWRSSTITMYDFASSRSRPSDRSAAICLDRSPKWIRTPVHRVRFRVRRAPD